MRSMKTTILVVILILASVAGTVRWFEADKEVRILCGLMTAGTPRAEVARILGTAERLEVRPAAVDVERASQLSFDAPGNLRTTLCAVSLDDVGVSGSDFTRVLRLERLAAALVVPLVALLTALQLGLATGRVSGRMAWGGRFETLPRSHRVASAVTAPAVLAMGWILLERAGVTGLLGSAAVVETGAWIVALVFLVSTAGNLASSSRSERLLGIPLATAMAILSVVIAYSG